MYSIFSPKTPRKPKVYIHIFKGMLLVESESPKSPKADANLEEAPSSEIYKLFYFFLKARVYLHPTVFLVGE